MAFAIMHGSFLLLDPNLILKAGQPDVNAGMLRRLLVGTVAMLTFGHCG